MSLRDTHIPHTTCPDLLGAPTAKTIELTVYHDERRWEHWLYHGFTLVERCKAEELSAVALSLRQHSKWWKAVHFWKLKGSSNGSPRTQLAVAWAKALDHQLLPLMRFFLLGIDESIVDHTFFDDGTGSRAEISTRVYNKFFEIGLFTALRWFHCQEDKVVVEEVVAEERGLHDHDRFRQYVPYRINHRESNVIVNRAEVKMLPGKADQREPLNLDLECLQMTDVFVGGFCQVLDAPNRKPGCTEVGMALLPRVKKLNKSPFNKNSCAWKRLAMRFFPTAPPQKGLVDVKAASGFMYERRPLKMTNDPRQMTLFR